MFTITRKAIAFLIFLNLSRLFHCSVINVLICFCCCQQLLYLITNSSACQQLFYFCFSLFFRQLVYVITCAIVCQQLFSFRKRWFGISPAAGNCHIPCRFQAFFFSLRRRISDSSVIISFRQAEVNLIFPVFQSGSSHCFFSCFLNWANCFNF